MRVAGDRAGLTFDGGVLKVYDCPTGPLARLHRVLTTEATCNSSAMLCQRPCGPTLLGSDCCSPHAGWKVGAEWRIRATGRLPKGPVGQQGWWPQPALARFVCSGPGVNSGTGAVLPTKSDLGLAAPTHALWPVKDLAREDAALRRVTPAHVRARAVRSCLPVLHG